MSLMRLSSLILLGIFYLSVWANPNCEIRVQTSYGRIIRMLALNKFITPDELRELAQKNEPTNPFHRREKMPEHVAFREIIDREIKREVTSQEWLAIKAEFERIVKQLEQGGSQEDQAREETRGVLKPKLYATVGPQGYRFKFNPLRNEVVGWKAHFISEPHNTPYYIFDIEKKEKKIVGELHRNATILIRRNGDVWTAGVSRRDEIVVRNLTTRKLVGVLPKNGDVQLDFFETSSGRVILANATDANGLYVYDVTGRNTTRTLLEYPGDSFRNRAVFYESPNGEVYLAASAKSEMVVYRLVNENLTPIGRIAITASPQNNHVIIATDADGGVILGHAIDTKNGYRLVKFIDGKTREIFSRGDLDGTAHSATFRKNSVGDLILTLSRSWDKKLVQIVNVSNSRAPEIKIGVESQLEVPPEWYKLPDGNEVLAISSHGNSLLIASPLDGTIFWKSSKARGNSIHPPLWMPTRDGKILLGVDTSEGLQIYDMWMSVSAGGAR